jgi:hypothetical protein
MPQIALWIPIDADCNVVFNKISRVCNEDEEDKALKKWPETPVTVIGTKTISVTKVQKNPFCYWVEQGGEMVERCI